MCFQKHAKGLLSRCTKVAGASAGSLVGSLYVLAPERMEEGLHNLYKLADELNALTFGALTTGFSLNERLCSIIHEYIPVTIIHAQKKLHVSLTNQSTRENVLISSFETREYLLNCLMASCFIPLYSSGITANAPEIDGVAYIDGGFSENLHVFSDMPTISVSPFSGSARIAPNDHSPLGSKLFGEWRMRLGNQYLKVNMQNIVRGAQALFPPSREVLTGYYDMGFRDAMKFLLDEGLLERGEGSDGLANSLGDMSVAVVFLRKIVSLLQCLVAGIRRIFTFRRKAANIGELPFTVSRSERADFSAPVPTENTTWDDGWQNASSFHEETVSSKIEEYRRKKADEMRKKEHPAVSGEPDFFNDMQPTIKAEKTILFKNDAKQSPAANQSRNLFAFNEDSVTVPQSATAELGELNFDSHENHPGHAEAWDTEIDLDEVQSALEDQKRRDREEKHKQRREEHEKRLKEKRSAAFAS
ncbi:hypothetical protein QR680_017122 [Steinernema hermaphroditum]|uniref:PNPLA domain-containing protein n=1 Tax=Steinernema hermaphroditum TaxID=289476 RepID=A0AA39LNK0_9BILA|nr:hypothetical protein QR680_017122 [Steinernema hermaphroditum]